MGYSKKRLLGLVDPFFQRYEGLCLYCANDAVQAECLKFCFMPLIQKELYKVAVLWNLHKIRPTNNAESPSGRPDMLYFVPDVTGGADLKQDVDIDDIELTEQRCCYRYAESGCCVEFTQLASITSIIMQEQNLDMPETA